MDGVDQGAGDSIQDLHDSLLFDAYAPSTLPDVVVAYTVPTRTAVRLIVHQALSSKLSVEIVDMIADLFPRKQRHAVPLDRYLGICFAVETENDTFTRHNAMLVWWLETCKQLPRVLRANILEDIEDDASTDRPGNDFCLDWWFIDAVLRISTLRRTLARRLSSYHPGVVSTHSTCGVVWKEQAIFEQTSYMLNEFYRQMRTLKRFMHRAQLEGVPEKGRLRWALGLLPAWEYETRNVLIVSGDNGRHNQLLDDLIPRELRVCPALVNRLQKYAKHGYELTKSDALRFSTMPSRDGRGDRVGFRSHHRPVFV
jgi:hypothetical protein